MAQCVHRTQRDNGIRNRFCCARSNHRHSLRIIGNGNKSACIDMCGLSSRKHADGGRGPRRGSQCSSTVKLGSRAVRRHKYGPCGEGAQRATQ